MRRPLTLFLLLAATVLVWLATKPAPPSTASLTVYCAAGLKKPVEALAKQF